MKQQKIICKVWKLDGLRKKMEEVAKEKGEEASWGWCFALLEEEPGVVTLVEAYYSEEGFVGYCNADIDIILRERYSEMLEKDPKFYDWNSWEEYRSNVFRDLFKLEEE